MPRICVIPGDGIGKEVIGSCIRVMESLDIPLDFKYAEMGLECHKETGEYLPKETFDLVKSTDSTLFGAITTPKDPNYKSPLLRLRQELELYANVRPVKCINPQYCMKEFDLVVVRENTEGLYTQIEYEEEGRIVTKRIVSEEACRRIIKFGFEYAVKNGRKGVCCVHKANVLRKSDGMFLNTFYGMGVNYAFYHHIKSSDLFVDNAAMSMAAKPEEFDVIVTLNLYGDILSDLASGLIGGRGFAPSGNIGEVHSVFEPSHGSALDIAGKNIANPTAALLSGAMQLSHLGYEDEALQIETALRMAYENGVETHDVGGSYKTTEFTDEVIKLLNAVK